MASTRRKRGTRERGATRLPVEADLDHEEIEVDVLAIESSEDSELEGAETSDESELEGGAGILDHFQQCETNAVSDQHTWSHTPFSVSSPQPSSIRGVGQAVSAAVGQEPDVVCSSSSGEDSDLDSDPNWRPEVAATSEDSDSDSDPNWYPKRAATSSQRLGSRKRGSAFKPSDNSLRPLPVGSQQNGATQDQDHENIEVDILTIESSEDSESAGGAIGNQRKEIQSPNNDNSLFCDDCSALHHGDCPVHGPLKPLDSSGQDQASLAHTPLPVPSPLTVKPSSIPGAGLGVFATQFIPKRVRVGPYEGKRVDKQDLGRLQDNEYVWELREGIDIEGAVDASDPTHSNWLRFVNCARNEEEQNLTAFQYRGEIYYRTFKDIYPGTELLVWYGDQYASELGLCMTREGPTAMHRCLGCGCAFARVKSLQLHVKYSSRCASANPQAHTCGKCRRQFHQLEALQQHIRRHILLDSICKRLAGKHECKICGKRFQTYTSWRSHILLHRDPTCECEHCGKAFVYKHDLEVHLRKHTGEKPWKCKHCGKRFSQSGNLERHIRIHTGVKPFKCDFCDKFFRHKAALDKHIRIHSGEKPHKCERCGKCFNGANRLKRHFITHTTVGRPHKCEICGKSYKLKYNLTMHLRTHSESNPFKCKGCGKSFGCKSHLDVHLRTHAVDVPCTCGECEVCLSSSSSLQTCPRTAYTVNKPFRCGECRAGFSSSSALQAHLRTHALNHPFRCGECGAGFSSSSALHTHLRTHNMARPFSCGQCGRRFRQKTHLQKHLWTHSDEKRYKCGRCGKGYSDNKFYKRHLLTHSTEKPL